MTLQWEDTSSYSRGDRGKVNPSSVTTHIGKARIVVHRWKGLDGWFVTCHPWLDVRELKTKDLEAAKELAVGLVKMEIDTYHDAWAKDYLTLAAK